MEPASSESSGKVSSFFKSIDAALFEQIDAFKTSAVYLKFVELLNAIPREKRVVLNQAVTVFLILFPVITLSFLFFHNGKLLQTLDQKRDILRFGNEVIAQERELKNTKRAVFTYPPVKNKSDLDAKIRGALTKFNINAVKVSTQNFQLDASFPSIFRTTTSVEFNRLSTNQLVELINYLISFEKMKVDELSVTKDLNEGLLKGNFLVSLYGEENVE